MKAKRIVSILLTGSMLLSLLPVSALAAAPVFDAPAQTTAKKAVPLVQEADASRSTEEEAATRSSRDLDAENGTAESITTIQLNAAGKPASEGNFGNWYYSAASGCQLDTGVFALQPSSEPEAESALKARLFRIDDNAELVRGTVGCETINYGTIFDGIFQGKVTNFRTISGGTFQGEVNNWGTISNGTFQREVDNQGTISNGTFQQPVNNSNTISDGIFQGKVANFRTISGGTFEEVVEMNESPDGVTIEGGTFKKGIKLNAGACYPIITDGLFDGKVSAAEGYSGTLSIRGGLFTKAVDISNTGLPNLQITGGYFVSKPTVPEGSVSFTSVSDQNGGPFQVFVNKGWSDGYNELYVPSGSSEQPNTITVKTAAPLTDCLAGDVSIMDSVQANADGSYAIDVHSPASIVLVTAEPAPGEPGGELDPEFSSGAAALGIVLGTAGLGYVTYVCGSSLYLHYVLPDGFIPSTRQELATVLWTTAGKPDPVSTALYTDIPADAIEQQKAARWCAEQGLLSDHGETFGPDMKVYNARIIRAWNSLKKLPVPIK
ncbi:hypothetical protein [Faecalibacterium langellae]|uniref:Uncharacterized protein n=1 Tax=Faecalibacterium langellae TaxID=3435293 RepID=A0ACC9D0J6_9FIRM|nr:hypothetical protein [Faecalibacterium prausnitzii]PDX61686.1 hypothetical protein CGS49_04625 [Faecalibacterium prausnitzii]